MINFQEPDSSEQDDEGEEEGSPEKAETVEEKKKEEKKKEEEEEFEILTIIPRTSRHSLSPSQHDCQEYKVTADTNIIFLAKKYNLVFVLDISPSAAAPVGQIKTLQKF